MCKVTPEAIIRANNKVSAMAAAVSIVGVALGGATLGVTIGALGGAIVGLKPGNAIEATSLIADEEALNVSVRYHGNVYTQQISSDKIKSSFEKAMATRGYGKKL